jgi:hypothetical protein
MKYYCCLVFLLGGYKRTGGGEMGTQNIMAQAYEKVDHEAASRQDNIVAHQILVHELMTDLTSFFCPICPQVNLYECSPDYLIKLDHMKQALYNVMGMIRDLLADWPMQCECMVKLQHALDTTFEMARYLCFNYDNAYSIGKEDEAEAIELYEAIYQDAYKFHTLLVHVLSKCLQSHTFLRWYPYPANQACVACRYCSSSSRDHSLLL